MTYRRRVLTDIAEPSLNEEVAKRAQRRDLDAYYFFICDNCYRSWLPNFDAAPHVLLGMATPVELKEAIGIALGGWISLYLLGCGFPLATLCRACARISDGELLASSVGERVLGRFILAPALESL